MPDYQVTFIFDLPGHGFSESYWKNFSSDSLDIAFDNALQLGLRRLYMCGEQTVLQAIRISDGELGGRTGRTFYVGQTGYTGKGSMASNVALNVLLSTANAQHSKMVQFRGCWDEVEVTGGAFDKSNVTFQNGFDSWRQWLLANGYGWRGIVSQQLFNVTTYVTDPSSVVMLTMSTPTGGLGSEGTRRKARFSKINVKSVINGPQIIRVGAGNTVFLAKPLAVGPFVSPGIMSVPSYITRAAASATIQRIGTRQAGAPLLRSRGRAPARPRT